MSIRQISDVQVSVVALQYISSNLDEMKREQREIAKYGESHGG